jgi:hypothetical protein
MTNAEENGWSVVAPPADLPGVISVVAGRGEYSARALFLPDDGDGALCGSPQWVQNCVDHFTVRFVPSASG